MNLTTTLLLSIVVFLGIVLLLVALLLFVRSKLISKDKVKITINNKIIPSTIQFELDPADNIATCSDAV